MDFKAFLFCFSLFVIAASGASLGEDQKRDSVSEYAIKVNNGRQEIDEKITIDTEDETETFHIKDNDTGNIDVLVDFKQNLSMYLISERKVCLLSNSTDRQPKPGDLIKELQSDAQQGPTRGKPKQTIVYAVGDPVADRSFLSDMMANMCAELPIYYLVPEIVTVDVQGKKFAKRKKRGVFCFIVIIGILIIIV
ncbi:leukocyte cell-derived chemotaxin 1-like [Montipora foliosa]|uniref:leukocyte cell-derived chemotaxin 1-like n=1 Tax=Montipora foliosa TaxID=591990 RepID=UPI0035F14308